MFRQGMGGGLSCFRGGGGFGPPSFMPKLTPGAANTVDMVTRVGAVSSISGARYGIVNGAVTQFAVNQPPIEDYGLRGCPAFTQQAKYTEDVTNAVWGKTSVTATLLGTYQNTNVFSVVETTNNTVHGITHSSAFAGAADNSVIGLRLVCKPKGRTKIEFGLYYKDGTYPLLADFDLATKSYAIKKTGGVASIKELSDGWFELFGAISCGAGGTTPQIYYQFLNESSQAAYAGDGVSGLLIGQPTLINFGVNGIPFIPPYVPNNTTSSVSVVSEAATATTGTSFDLDDVKLSPLKNAFRGVGVGPNLWGTPGISTPPWSDNGTYYVCDGTNNSATCSKTGAVSTGKLYEMTFTTGSVTSGLLWVYLGGIQIFNGTPTANTTYTLRTNTLTTGVNVTFTNGNAFIGQIRKDIVVKEIQAQGHLDLEFVSNTATDWIDDGGAVHCNIFSCGDIAYRGLSYRAGSDSLKYFKLQDSVDNSATINNSSVLPGQSFKISLDWGTHSTGQKMRITVNGVKSSLSNFSGSFGGQDMRFFYNNTVHAGWIKKDSLKIFDRPIW